MNRLDATSISLHAAAPAGGVALCAALGLPAGDTAPEWVHLLPAGEIVTADGRGPYRVPNLTALMAASLRGGDRLPIDENHATDLAAPNGLPAPARGWIVALEARADGLWGKVEWTPIGRRLVAGRAYRGISPVIQHRPNGEVLAILRASLVNKPNLRGLTALHQETTMDLLARLAAALSLAATVTEDEIVAKVTALHAEAGASATALQAALDPIARAAGLKAGADAAAVLAGVQQLATGGDKDVITGLQAELTAVTTRLNTLMETGKREKAQAYVDAEIKRGRVGLKPQRDRYIALHMADEANAVALIEALPVLGGAGEIVPATPPGREGEIALNAEQRAVAGLLGIPEDKMIETIKAERAA